MTPKRVSKKPLPAVTQWTQKIHLSLMRERLRVPEKTQIHLAALISLLPEKEQQEGYWVLRGFLLQKDRLPRLPQALARIPPEREKIQEVIAVLKTWTRITERPLSYGRLKTDQVVEVILQITNHERYIIHLSKKGFFHLGAIFHPNTLAQTSKELRGLTGKTSHYWKKSQGQLNILDDDD